MEFNQAKQKLLESIKEFNQNEACNEEENTNTLDEQAVFEKELAQVRLILQNSSQELDKDKLIKNIKEFNEDLKSKISESQKILGDDPSKKLQPSASLQLTEAYYPSANLSKVTSQGPSS